MESISSSSSSSSSIVQLLEGKIQNQAVKNVLSTKLGQDTTLAELSMDQLQDLVLTVDNLFQSTSVFASMGRSLHKSSSVLIVVSRAFRTVVWNDYATQITGYTTQDTVGNNIISELPGLFPPDSCRMIENGLVQCLQGHSKDGVILDIARKDGLGSTRLLCTLTPLLGALQPEGMMIVGQNAAKLTAIPTPATAGMTPVELLTKNVAPITSKQPIKPNRFAGWNEVQDYVIENVLGQGSYGQVAKVRHKETGEVFAIKKIQNVFADPIDAKRILRELCILRNLHHPNIVQIKEVIRPKDFENFADLYVVFELLPTDLEKLLHSPQFLSAEHLRWLLLDLLKAVKYLHSAHIVHRDLKPANLLLNLSPVSVKLCDFGLARSVVPTSVEALKKRKLEREHSILDDGHGVHPRTPRQQIQRQLTEHVVTRWYRAPEIIFRDQDYSTEIDVWSIGCIFAELLSMQKASVPSHYQREPLFPGVSCFPLSPGAHAPALPQDSRDQLNVILDVLGTMSEEDISEVADGDVRAYLRSLDARPAKPLKDIYPGAEESALELLAWMLQMNPRKRVTIDQALSHPYLESIRNLEEEDVAPHAIPLDFDEKVLRVRDIRRMIQDEIRFYHPDSETVDKKIKSDT